MWGLRDGVYDRQQLRAAEKSFNDLFHLVHVLGAILAGLFALAFAAASAVYIWGWQARLALDSNTSRDAAIMALMHRSGAFGILVVVIFALTVGAFIDYRATLAESSLVWIAALVAVEVLVFVWCFVRFLREFGSPQKATVAHTTATVP